MGVLRFFLALSVVQGHANGLFGIRMLDGRLAVQAFYLISGFYMALVLHEKYRPGEATYLQFIGSRFLRIFPAYFLVLSLTILLWFWSYRHYGESVVSPYVLWEQSWAHFDWRTKFFLVLSHLVLFGQDAYLFLGLGDAGGLYFDSNFQANQNTFWKFLFVPQSWSLSLELCFYMLAPFLVRRSVPVLAMMIALSLAVRFALAHGLGWHDDPWSYRFFPSELALFLCGAGSYRVYRAARTGNMDAKTWAGWGALGIAVGLALKVSHDELNLSLLMSKPSVEAVIWLNAGFVVAVVLALPFLFRLTQHSRIDRHLGELSYPMYLSHMLVIWLFNLMQMPDGLGRSSGILVVLLSLSLALYWWVDRRVDAFRHKQFSAAA